MRRLDVQLVVLVSTLAVVCAVHGVRGEAGDGKGVGRVEGIVRVGAKPGVHMEVILERNEPMPTGRKPRRRPNTKTTDRKGRFVFENVEPGEWRVGLFKQYSLRNTGGYTRMSTSSHAVRFGLDAGKTARVQIGGTGRPVVGRLVPPKGEDVQVAFEGGSARRIWLKTPRPPYPKDLSDDERRAWYEKWCRSDEGKALWRQRRTYVVDVAPDGTFRAEDIPPGDYALHIEVARRGEELGRASGYAGMNFTVPPIPAGRSDKPLDLGEVAVVFEKRLEVGQPAPDFEVVTVDGKPVKLADYKGKWVLLDFWATWCGPCKAETPNLKAVWDRFGKGPRFAMIGLSIDKTPAEPRDYAKQNGLGWVQGFVKGGTGSKIAQDYCVRGIPSILLIGPDGKIRATRLRGKRIEPAVESALSGTTQTGRDQKAKPSPKANRPKW